MKILFVHQNMPGQYREFLDWLLEVGGHDIAFLTQRRDFKAPDGVRKVLYKSHHLPQKGSYGLSNVWEEAAGVGFGAAEACRKLLEEGYTPDIILGHTGWGELLFLKHVWPQTPILGFFEYYYNMTGGTVGFDPEDPPSPHTPYLLQARNTVPQQSLHVVDRGIAPTHWQKERFPKIFHDKIYACHDGIRTDRLRPNPKASIRLGRVERTLTKDDEIITYMARNLEKTRGFHIMMRALPEILEARPNARVVLIGGSGASYGPESKSKGGFRADMEREVGARIDWSRVHFVGKVPYEDFQRIVQVSRCHIYLTMPFVLSWSLLECMSMGATIVSSDVAPVREAITHGQTGLLVDFFDPSALARQVIDVAARPEVYADLGPAARDHVVKTYDFKTVCLPEHIRQMNALLPADKHMTLSN